MVQSREAVGAALKGASSSELVVALKAATTATALVQAARTALSFTVESKVSLENQVVNKNNTVTSADRAAERCIVEIIRAAFPDHHILGEESAPHIDPALLTSPLWIIDPIDGTTNFIRDHRHVAISIAFADKGRVECGVVAAPFMGEVFSAQRGAGAFLNGQRLRIDHSRAAADSLVALGYPHFHPPAELWRARLSEIMEGVRDVRRLGAAALDLSWIAAGRVDGFWETLHPWDVAAGILICREAGAEIGRGGVVPPEFLFPDDFCGYELIVGTQPVFGVLKEVAAKFPA